MYIRNISKYKKGVFIYVYPNSIFEVFKSVFHPICPMRKSFSWSSMVVSSSLQSPYNFHTKSPFKAQSSNPIFSPKPERNTETPLAPLQTPPKMQTLRKITATVKQVTPNLRLQSTVKLPTTTRQLSSRNSRSGEDEWNEAWESAWLPQDLTPKARAPWEGDVNFVTEADAETKAFVEEMNENWNERRKGSKKEDNEKREENGALYSLENIKKDYRLKKQKLHAGLWSKEIEKLEEAKLGDSDVPAGDDDIQRLLNSCAEYVSFSFFPSLNLFYVLSI